MKKILFAVIIGIVLCSIFALPIIQNQAQVRAASQEECIPNDKTTSSFKCDAGTRPNDELCCPQGLMVCGTPCCRCRLCDIFKLIDKLIDFVIFKLVPIASIILIIVGGTIFLISSGDPSKISRATGIILSVIIGLTIMYSSYMIVGFVLKNIGLADWVTKDTNGKKTTVGRFLDDGVFEIDCGGDVDSATSFCNSLTDAEQNSNDCRIYKNKGRLDLCKENPCNFNAHACRVWLDPAIGSTKIIGCTNN